MLNNKKIILKFTPVILLTVFLFIFFAYKLNKPKDDAVVIQSGNIYQKVSIPSGVVAQTNSIERNDLSDFSGLPDKNDREFHKNYTLIRSEDKNKVIVASFIGQGESTNKQKEFICNLSKKECIQSKLLFNNYKSGNLDIMSHFVWWMGWNSKNNTVIGLITNEVNNGKIYACNTTNQLCKESPKDKLNFPQGAISNSFNKIVAVKQNDIINEKTGDKWELLVYNIDDLSKPINTYDISSAIDRDDDIFYDGVNSVAWSKNDKIILIGTSRNIFKLSLNNGKLDKIFTDISENDDDFYWNSNKIIFSPSERYVIFIDTIDVSTFTERKESDKNEVVENEEGVLKIIDLQNKNKVEEIFQATDLVLK